MLERSRLRLKERMIIRGLMQHLILLSAEINIYMFGLLIHPVKITML